MFCCTGFLSTNPCTSEKLFIFLSLEETVSAVPSAAVSGTGFKQMQRQPLLPAPGAARRGTGWGQTAPGPRGRARGRMGGNRVLMWKRQKRDFWEGSCCPR